jgi:ABC-2 type transport system permease protein
MQTFLTGNALMKQMFLQSHTSIEASFTGTITTVLVGLGSILPIVLVNHLKTEETRSHLSQLFVTQVSRLKLYVTTISLALFLGVIGLLLGSGSLGVVALGSMHQATHMTLGTFLAAGLNNVPLVFMIVGLAGVILGWLPQLSKVVYIYLGYSVMLSYFGNLLTLPKWVTKTAMQNWLPHLPVETFELWQFSLVLCLGLVLIIVGYLGYSHRDFREGA